MKAEYRGVDGVARKIIKEYRGVSGVAREVTKAYRGVNGVARQFFQYGTPASQLAVGSSVYLNVSGVQTEFLIVHQGLPSSVYDSSCNGTWLLMKDIVGLSNWGVDSSGQCFDKNPPIRTYLDNTFAPMLDTAVYNQIKTVSIPVMTRRNGDKSVLGTASLKVFLLSTDEINRSKASDSKYPTLVEGSALSYFANATDSSRLIANYNGSAKEWWTRTKIKTLPSGYERVHRVSESGSVTAYRLGSSLGVRPAMILPSTALFDDQNVIIT